MATYKLFDDIETFPDASFQADSFQLDEFVRGDFSSMQDELNEIMPSNENIVLRHFPIVEKMAKDSARPYVRRVNRTFGEVTDAHARMMGGVYRDLKMNSFMLRTAMRASAQNGICVAPVPARNGRIRLFNFIPGEVVVERDDPMEDDIRYASKVTIRCPIKQKGSIAAFGRLVFTPGEAYIETGDEKVGVFAPNRRNPFGYIPAVVARFVQPASGWFWGPLKQAWAKMQISVDVAISDVDMTCRFQAHGKESLVGPGARVAAAGASKVRSGADVILAIDTMSDDRLEYDIKNSNPATDKYLAAILFQIELFERLNCIASGSLTPGGTGSSAITGRGKEVERLAELEERNRLETIWSDFEDDLGGLVADLVSHRGLVRIPRPTVDIDYQYVEVPDNDLQATQSAVLRYLVGRDSPGEQVAREENLDNAEAGWKVVEERLKKNARFLASLRGADVPGLDSISGFAQGTQNTPDAQGTAEAAA